jgi:hypothetical protein
VVGLHPDQPANTVSRDKFEFLWEQVLSSYYAFKKRIKNLLLNWVPPGLLQDESVCYYLKMWSFSFLNVALTIPCHSAGQSARLMEIGVNVGNIITVLPEDAGASCRKLHLDIFALIALLLIIVDS